MKPYLKTKRIYILDVSHWGQWKDLGDEYTPAWRTFPSRSRAIVDERTIPGNNNVNVVSHFSGEIILSDNPIVWYGSWSFYKYVSSAADFVSGAFEPDVVPDYTVALPAEKWDVLVERAFTKMSSEAGLGKVNQTLPFVGELHKTVRMLKHPLEFLSKMPNSRGLRKLSLGQALRQVGLGPASDAWLTYKYGWKPLMSDLLAFGNAFSRCAKDYETYTKGKTSGRVFRSEQALNYTNQRTSSDQPSGWWWQANDTLRARCIIWGKLRPHSETKPYYDYVVDRFGLSAENLITTAWELIPYSFVVDWFIPVGDYLGRISSTRCEFELVKTMFDLRSDSHVDHMYRYTAALSQGYSNEAAGRQYIATVKGRKYSRQTKPLAGPYGEDWTFSNNHVVTALALIGQRLKLPI